MENRRHPRTKCFLVSHDHDLTPIWVFGRATEDSILALVVDFSEGGIQVLIEKEQALDTDTYTLFIDGIREEALPESGFKVLLKWTGEHSSLYPRSGFEFADPETAKDCVQVLRRQIAAGKPWIRCELEGSKREISGTT